MRKDSTKDEFERIHINDYTFYFNAVDDAILVPKLKKIKTWRFFKMIEESKKYESLYFFKVELKLLRKIQREIFLPIFELKDNDTFLQFSDSIHYSLEALEKFCEMGNLVDLNTEIDKVANYLSEVQTFCKQINTNADKVVKNEQLNTILMKHHDTMDSLLLSIKYLNSN